MAARVRPSGGEDWREGASRVGSRWVQVVGGGLLILDQARGEQPRRREQVSGEARHGASAIPGAKVKEKRGFCEKPSSPFSPFSKF